MIHTHDPIIKPAYADIVEDILSRTKAVARRLGLIR
jgi:hypothetical protein